MTHAVRPSELREMAWVYDAIAARRGAKAVQAALVYADHRLHYVSTAQYRWQLELESRLERLRHLGVTPMRILVRVVQVFAIMEKNPRRFKTERAEKVALARAVLNLRPNQGRPAGRILYYFGCMLSEDFGIFARALFKDLAQEAKQRANMLQTMSDFTPISEVSP